MMAWIEGMLVVYYIMIMETGLMMETNLVRLSRAVAIMRKHSLD